MTLTVRRIFEPLFQTLSPPGPLPSASDLMVVRNQSRQVHRFVKAAHTYLGLLNFSHLIVFGIAGLVATFPACEAGQPSLTTVRHEPLPLPAGLSDEEVADLVYRTLDLPLSGPLPGWALRHDAGRASLTGRCIGGGGVWSFLGMAP